MERTETETVPQTSDGDHDTFTHIVRRKDLDHSRATGEAVQALCGKVWVPRKDPDRYPLCGTCRAIWERLGAATSN